MPAWFSVPPDSSGQRGRVKQKQEGVVSETRIKSQEEGKNMQHHVRPLLFIVCTLPPNWADIQDMKSAGGIKLSLAGTPLLRLREFFFKISCAAR
jgi:hypothetical protein